jgi:NADH-quinone oxidoreductase subunit E
LAWIAKPSGTQKIARRDTPYLTTAMRQHFTRDILPRYETKQGALLPILHEVQNEHGFIPYQAMMEVADFLDLKPADVLDTASFYEEFHLEPVGKHVIAVCQSVSCEVCGHQAILDHLKNKLGVEPHETTPDGRFTLLTLECLGSCDTAPVALVGDDLHENLTIEKIDQIIDALPE